MTESKYFYIKFYEDLNQSIEEKLSDDDYFGENGDKVNMNDLKKDIKELEKKIIMKQYLHFTFDVENSY